MKNNEIKVQNDSLAKMALFPAHNPNPVIELDFNYKVIYFNDSAKLVLVNPQLMMIKIDI